jgi:hypothetical protein
MEYGTIPSRRSSKALVPLPHIPDLPVNEIYLINYHEIDLFEVII